MTRVFARSAVLTVAADKRGYLSSSSPHNGAGSKHELQELWHLKLLYLDRRINYPEVTLAQLRASIYHSTEFWVLGCPESHHHKKQDRKHQNVIKFYKSSLIKIKSVEWNLKMWLAFRVY